MELPLSISSSGKQLSAVLHQQSSSRIVIFAHGFRANKTENGRLFVTAARAIAAAGISAIRFDFMGSGDSEGEFYEMSPSTEVADLLNVFRWCKRKQYKKIGFLGLSLGGAISILSAHELHADASLKALVTWSTLPQADIPQENMPEIPRGKVSNPILVPGKKFFIDRPSISIPEAYCSLTIPKLAIQGDQDKPGFLELFQCYFPQAPAPKKHIIIPGADHVFTHWPHRKKVIALTVGWFKKYLE